MMFFITESKSVLDEKARSNALGCGMIQDLGVHMFDLFLETLIYCNEWKCDPNDDRMARRVGGHIDLMSVAKQVQQNTPFSGGVETFAAIDLRVTEQIAMPIRPGQSDISDVPVHDNSFDVLFVLGKGVVPTQGVAKDVKAIVIEHERKGSPTIIDLASLGTIGIPNDDINTHHGGMNRPLMLLATNPPDHAMERLGGHEYAQWQSFALGMRVAKIANSASSIQPGRMSAYINQRPIPDLLHDMVNEGELRSTWSDIRSLQQYSAASIKDSTFFD